MTNKIFFTALIIVFCLSFTAVSQEKINFSGSFQTDILFPQKDEQIDTEEVTDNFLSNNYLNLNLNSKFVDAGARLELLTKPLVGFEPEFAGAGLPNLYVTGKYKNYSLTLGNFYEQFGSGFIFRTYEERTLGIDNSLRGARFIAMPYKGVRIKALGGFQRIYFNYNKNNYWGFDFSQGAVWGGDLELNINEWFKKLNEKNWNILLGASFVSRFQPDEDILPNLNEKLNLPKNVAACDFRLQLQKGNWSALAEYALKANDPSADNDYIYKKGSALMLSGTYSQKGLSALLQVKRSDNMSFRSVRSQRGTAAFINHLPAFSQTHTYALAALYPYATQPTGEWAFQGSFGYTFKKGTKMGGKYGTTFKLNASYICGLKKTDKSGKKYTAGVNNWGTEGYNTNFFGFDSTYYTDVNLEFSKKISKTFSLSATYMFQIYNQKIIEKEGHLKKSHIAIVDLKYQPHSKFAFRGEVQYLFAQDMLKFSDYDAKDERGDWLFALAEISLFRSLMIYASDLINVGGNGNHYYNGGLTYTIGAHRIGLAYGRTRAGYNCSGGVCRWVPAYKGVQVNYNVSF
ncbi:MAG: DUF6029 family protein [Prevotellaceae bacterium]|jgi:hypothetical protein|nr:DUF6029 family protein [Prevotellaceae bacterium]